MLSEVREVTVLMGAGVGGNGGEKVGGAYRAALIQQPLRDAHYSYMHFSVHVTPQ